MLRVLRVLQIQANRLWTWLEGEAEESEEEEEEEEEEAADDGDEEEEEEEEEEDDDVPWTPHGKKQARGRVKREHSEDEPHDTVVPEKRCGAPVSSARCSATWLPPLCFRRIRRRRARRGTILRASKEKDLAPLG